MAAGSDGWIGLVLLALLVLVIWLLGRPGDKPGKNRRQRPWANPVIRALPIVAENDHNPGGPLTERQARKLFEDVLQAAIRQKAEAILIDSLSGRPQVRLRLEGNYQELTGVGDAESFRRLAAQARSCAGLSTVEASSPGSRGSFLRLYRRGHLRNAGLRVENGEISYAFQETSRRNRAVRFDLESFPAPGGEALRISLRPEVPAESTCFDLGFAAAAERKYIEAVHEHSGIVLLTGPCNAGKSTATYRALSLLRDEGRKVVTVEWPMEMKLDGVVQYHLHGLPDPYGMIGACLQRAIRRKPDVLMLQNIDWVNADDARAAIDFAAAGGLLITAVHVRGCASGLGSILWRHFAKQRQDAAELLRIVVAPRRLFMVCMHCAEEVRVPARILREAGMSDPPAASDGRVATWRGRGCPLCGNSGEFGSIAVYEVLELGGEMKRFIENSNDWYSDQVDYLERQACLHGMRTQRELALERVLAGDISLQTALLNTVKPKWLAEVQAARR
jgi:type II secretory ATPase GspE/PulE/Tfp pilus assembly ATPase PilB-like protein